MTGNQSSTQLDPELRVLVDQIKDADNQGVPLAAVDYVLLGVVTLLVPAVLITLGMVLS